LTLLSASPWHGWGKGNAGNAHYQWAQDATNQQHYADLLNGYLQVAADFGVFSVIILLVLVFLPYACFVNKKNCSSTKEGVFALAAMCSFTALCICHFFSTLWIYRPVLFLTIGSYAIFMAAVLGRLSAARTLNLNSAVEGWFL